LNGQAHALIARRVPIQGLSFDASYLV
jgi:hypothetical protein